jgi:hypothetical protein
MNVTTTKQTEFSIRRIRPTTQLYRRAPSSGAPVFWCWAVRLMQGPFQRWAAPPLCSRIDELPSPGNRLLMYHFNRAGCGFARGHVRRRPTITAPGRHSERREISGLSTPGDSFFLGRRLRLDRRTLIRCACLASGRLLAGPPSSQSRGRVDRGGPSLIGHPLGMPLTDRSPLPDSLL